MWWFILILAMLFGGIWIFKLLFDFCIYVFVFIGAVIYGVIYLSIIIIRNIINAIKRRN